MDEFTAGQMKILTLWPTVQYKNSRSNINRTVMLGINAIFSNEKVQILDIFETRQVETRYSTKVLINRDKFVLL